MVFSLKKKTVYRNLFRTFVESSSNWCFTNEKHSHFHSHQKPQLSSLFFFKRNKTNYLLKGILNTHTHTLQWPLPFLGPSSWLPVHFLHGFAHAVLFYWTAKSSEEKVLSCGVKFINFIIFLLSARFKLNKGVKYSTQFTFFLKMRKKNLG